MTLKLAVIMDPIEQVKIHKDSTFAMLLEAQQREISSYYVQSKNIFVIDGLAKCQANPIRVFDDPKHWFELDTQIEIALNKFDVILMRKDPPFNMEYIYTTYALELAQQAGVLVVNNPAALRDWNEKFVISHFPQCCTPTLITRDMRKIDEFLALHSEIIVKPLDGMGGESIFKITLTDGNKNAILEQVSQKGGKSIMAQTFIPEVTAGDKRILLINGEPVPYALARIPQDGEFRANLAAGGRGVGVPLSDQDRWICGQIGTSLRENGILFAGIDVIGSYLTEINITSPTCIRELDQQYSLNISGMLFNCIESLVSSKK